MLFLPFHFSLRSISFSALAFASLSLPSLFAQKQIDDQVHGWLVYQGNHHLSTKFDLHTEYQWRRADGFADWQQSLARIGLDYKLNPAVTISGGYGWIISYSYGSQPIPSQTIEHRLWQQVILKQPMGNFQVQHRYRLEQRWIDTQFKQRFRYRAQVLLPLEKSYIDQKKGFFMNINDEVFLGFGQGIGKNILDQNRFIGAVGYQFNKDFNIQMGYLNQFVIKTDGLHMERNHTLWTSLIYNLDFSK
jgi:hypothetical protein